MDARVAANAWTAMYTRVVANARYGEIYQGGGECKEWRNSSGLWRKQDMAEFARVVANAKNGEFCQGCGDDCQVWSKWEGKAMPGSQRMQ